MAKMAQKLPAQLIIGMNQYFTELSISQQALRLWHIFFAPAIEQHAGNYFIVFRSEEHTSEHQSLMRRSYAVFCVNNTTPTDKQHNSTINNSNTQSKLGIMYITYR